MSEVTSSRSVSPQTQLLGASQLEEDRVSSTGSAAFAAPSRQPSGLGGGVASSLQADVVPPAGSKHAELSRRLASVSGASIPEASLVKEHEQHTRTLIKVWSKMYKIDHIRQCVVGFCFSPP